MNKETLRKNLSKYGIFGVLILLILFFSIVSDKFANVDVFLTILRQNAVLGIASIGMACVLLLGGIDLSIGSNITFVNIVGALFMVKYGVNPILAALIAIAVSTLIGLINGFIIAKTTCRRSSLPSV